MRVYGSSRLFLPQLVSPHLGSAPLNSTLGNKMAYISTAENMEIIDALSQALRDLPVGEILPKARIDNLSRNKAHLVHRARNLIEREQGLVLGTVVGIGIKKLPANQAGLVGEQARLKAKRGVTKASKRIIGVVRINEREMTSADRAKLAEEVNKLGLVMEFCG